LDERRAIFDDRHACISDGVDAMRWIALAVPFLLAGGSAEAVEVGAIQGAAHASPVVGDRVDAEGVVTLVRGNGFFLQGAPDGDDATSDGVFVFSSALPEVTVGDRVRVEGRVVEFTPANRPQQLSFAELEAVRRRHGLADGPLVRDDPGGRASARDAHSNGLAGALCRG
jgi:hypothetical protein